MNGNCNTPGHFDVDGSSRAASGDERKRPTRFRRLVRRTLVFLVALVLLYCTGLGVFLYRISRAPAPIAEKADGIIVLTGGAARISQALSLLQNSDADRLLISGVNVATSREALRQQLDADKELFTCCVDLGREAINTEGNAAEAAAWVRSHGFDRIILVTSNYHMPRSLIEFQRYLPEVTVIAHPIAAGSPTNGGFLGFLSDPHGLRLLLLEYSKYIVAVSRSVAWDSWRSVCLPSTKAESPE